MCIVYHKNRNATSKGGTSTLSISQRGFLPLRLIITGFKPRMGRVIVALLYIKIFRAELPHPVRGLNFYRTPPNFPSDVDRNFFERYPNPAMTPTTTSCFQSKV
jgi:hypothetical protein